MQLSEIRDEIRLRYGVADTDALFTDDNLTDLINAARRRLHQVREWPWMETVASVNTVVDSNDLTLANDVRRILRMRYNNHSLRMVDARDISNYYGSTGSPRFWTYEAGFKVLPAADKIYAIEYVYIKDNESPLVNASDVPTWPDRAIDVLISYTAVLMARRERMMELESRRFAEYSLALQDTLDEQIRGMEGTTPRRTRAEEQLSGYYFV